MTTANVNSKPSNPKEHNKKLFKRLIDDLESEKSAVYTSAAKKLAKFLSRIEAYYPEAHEFIIRSLQTARRTLTRLTGSPDAFKCSSPCPAELVDQINAYRELVNTVVGFGVQFGQSEATQKILREFAMSAKLSEDEPDTLEQISIQDRGMQAPSFLGASGSSKLPPPILAPHVISGTLENNKNSPSFHAPIQVEESSKSPGNADSRPQAIGTSVVQPNLSQNATSQAIVQNPSISSSLGAATLPVSAPTSSATTSLSVNQSRKLAGKTTSSSATIPTKPKRKPKLVAPKVLLSADSQVVQEDAKWYDRQRNEGKNLAASASTISQANVSGSILGKPKESSTPLASEVELARPSEGENNSHNPPSQPNIADDDVIIVDYKPRKAEIIDLTLDDVQLELPRTDTDLHQDKNNVRDKNHDATDDTTLKVPLKDTSDPMDVDSEGNGRPLDQLSELHIHGNEQSGDAERPNTGQPGQLSDTTGSVRQIDDPQPMDRTPPLVDEPERMELSENSPRRSDILSIEAQDNGVKGSNQGRSDIQQPALGEQSMAQSTSPLTTPLRISSPDPAMIANGKDLSSSHIRSQSPQGGRDTNPSDKPRTASPEIISVFEPQTVGLVSINYGQTKGNHILIEFEVASGMETLNTLWKTRFNHDHNLTYGSCLSLACYSLDDIADTGVDFNDTDDLSTICEVLLSIHPSWPNGGTLRAKIGNRYILLSPPLITTRDKFVDLAPYVDGRNLQINLEHEADMTGFVFALFAHPPTPAQLRNLHDRRAKDQKWKSFLQEITRPFTKEEVYGA